MQIQRINSYFNSRNQIKAVGNPQQNYMTKINSSRANTASITDTVSFGMDLRPKLLSEEANILLGDSIKSIISKKREILEAINAPILALKKNSRVQLKEEIQVFPASTVTDLSLSETLDGTNVIFKHTPKSHESAEYVYIKSEKGDDWSEYKVQENCIEAFNFEQGKGVTLSKAYINEDTTLNQKKAIRIGAKTEMISPDILPDGIKTIDENLITALKILLGKK